MPTIVYYKGKVHSDFKLSPLSEEHPIYTMDEKARYEESKRLLNEIYKDDPIMLENNLEDLEIVYGMGWLADGGVDKYIAEKGKQMPVEGCTLDGRKVNRIWMAGSILNLPGVVKWTKNKELSLDEVKGFLMKTINSTYLASLEVGFSEEAAVQSAIGEWFFETEGGIYNFSVSRLDYLYGLINIIRGTAELKVDFHAPSDEFVLIGSGKFHSIEPESGLSEEENLDRLFEYISVFDEYTGKSWI